MAAVLVVDSGELGELLAALLGQYGMAASRARSGEEALEIALAERPRVAIIEHDLPDAGGVDVAELLWTHEASRTQGLTRALDASQPVDNEDVGEIAVLQDNGDLIARANPFDLNSVALRFKLPGTAGHVPRQHPHAAHRTRASPTRSTTRAAAKPHAS